MTEESTSCWSRFLQIIPSVCNWVGNIERNRCKHGISFICIFKYEGGCLKSAHLANTHSHEAFFGFSLGFS